MPYNSPFPEPKYTQQWNALLEARQASQSNNEPYESYTDHAGGQRVNTDVYMYNVIKKRHPDVEVLNTDATRTNILNYISSAGPLVGSVEKLDEDHLSSELPTNPALSNSINHIVYVPPFRRMDGGEGSLAIDIVFARFLVKSNGYEFLVYIANGRDGTSLYPITRQYICTSDRLAALALVQATGAWQNTLHGEIWVFDQGYWQKDRGLWQSIQKSNREDIILPQALKEDLLDTVQRFYDSKATYERLHVPWKRGLIFYGPPGNGKTVSIKATMKTLYDRDDPVPTLYVKTLKSISGPEASINAIFNKARQEAPCYLVFEDLDSIVSDDVRSFFLNAVDGLSENQGILMIGSTNHLDRLDPGIAKRPSRFDRKYLFPDPDLEQRIKYCQFWQNKLKDNKDIEFPDLLLEPIAKLTDGFSFAYIQEAFISTLLKIATDGDKKHRHERSGSGGFDMCELADELVLVGRHSEDKELEKYVLWREIKVQIANLKKELDKGEDQRRSSCQACCFRRVPSKDLPQLAVKCQ